MSRGNEGEKHDDSPNDSYYRRLEDQKWRDKVDTRLTSLTTDMMLCQERLENLEESARQLIALVEGAPTDKNDNGLKGDIHDLFEKVTRLWSVIFMDAAGEKGMLELFRQAQRKERRWEINRTSLTAIVVAAISIFGLLLREWPDIRDRWMSKKMDPVEQMIENVKHPKSKHRHIIVREAPPDPDGEN